MTDIQLGQWKCGDEIGRGPLGAVFRAVSITDPGKTVAVKVLKHELTLSGDFAQRFTGELLALHRLNHPNIARFHDAGVHAGTAYYASEFVEGKDLESLLKSTPRTDDPGLNWKDVVISVAVQAARALKHGHHRSILHRDLRPSNMILTPTGVLKVTDFGVGKVLPISPLSLPPDALGAAGYLAPEFFTGKPLTRRSDLYSLGAVLYTILTGRPPFTAATAAEMMHKHCYVLPDRPMQFVPKLPAELDDLICDLLQKDPARRPASAPAVIEALDQIRGKAERKGLKVVWPSQDGDTTDTQPALDDAILNPVRERPPMSRPAVVIPLFLLVIAVALGIYFWPRPSAEDLYNKAQPLLKSEDSADWDKAWSEYLEPLSQRYPEKYESELQSIRTRIQDHRRLRKALDDGEKARPKSEAERLYLRGVALVQVGDHRSAKVTWLTVVTLYRQSEAESRWVKLAEEGLKSLGDTTKWADRTEFAAEWIDRAKALKSEGKAADANAILDALLAVYRDHPAIVEQIQKAR